MHHRSWSATLPGIALAAGLLVLAPTPTPAQQMQMQTMTPSQAEVIRGLLPSVVNITSFVVDVPATAGMNAGAAAADQGPGRPKTVRGSGFVIDPSGVILTNHHVIAGAYDVQVMLSDGTTLPGRILATAAISDLALVKVDTPRLLAPVRWADSDKVQVADTVFAIGNPLGVGLSVSSGIVSGLNRDLMDSPFDDFIQTDAAINHGNSGGPLFNAKGEVIGIDTSIISPTTGSVGLGFAIPANDARYVADQLMREGQSHPAYLGVRIEAVTQDIAAALGMPQPLGAIIAAMDTDCPATKAELHVGDVVLRYGEETSSDVRALQRRVARSAIGQPVPVTVLRDGREHTVPVTPIAWPARKDSSGAGSDAAAAAAILVPPDLGLSLDMLSADLRARYGLHMLQAGVLVSGVAAGTDAFNRGLAAGDVILRMQGSEVGSPQEVQAAVDAARAQQRAFVLALVLPKASQNPGPHWVALKVADGMNRKTP